MRKLELLLALSLLSLLFQLFPWMWTSALGALDVRNWPRGVWFVANLIAVLTLVGIRFGPDMYGEWRERCVRHAAKRQNRQKQQELKEQREIIERIKASRQRRVY